MYHVRMQRHILCVHRIDINTKYNSQTFLYIIIILYKVAEL